MHPDGGIHTGVASDLIGPNQETIMVMMSTVSISELKANLSRYLREVRRGGEVQVLDRGAPVARLVPAAATDDEGSPGTPDWRRPASTGERRRRGRHSMSRRWCCR